MIAKGVGIAAKNDNGATTLHIAAEKGRMDFVEYLLHVRPSLLDVRDDLGMTPLFRAVKSRQFETSLYLTRNGADLNAKTAGGMTPLSRAQAESPELYGALLAASKGAKIRSPMTPIDDSQMYKDTPVKWGGKTVYVETDKPVAPKPLGLHTQSPAAIAAGGGRSPRHNRSPRMSWSPNAAAARGRGMKMLGRDDSLLGSRHQQTNPANSAPLLTLPRGRPPLSKSQPDQLHRRTKSNPRLGLSTGAIKQSSNESAINEPASSLLNQLSAASSSSSSSPQSSPRTVFHVNHLVPPALKVLHDVADALGALCLPALHLSIIAIDPNEPRPAATVFNEPLTQLANALKTLFECTKKASPELEILEHCSQVQFALKNIITQIRKSTVSSVVERRPCSDNAFNNIASSVRALAARIRLLFAALHPVVSKENFLSHSRNLTLTVKEIITPILQQHSSFSSSSLISLSIKCYYFSLRTFAACHDIYRQSDHIQPQSCKSIETSFRMIPSTQTLLLAARFFQQSQSTSLIERVKEVSNMLVNEVRATSTLMTEFSNSSCDPTSIKSIFSLASAGIQRAQSTWQDALAGVIDGPFAKLSHVMEDQTKQLLDQLSLLPVHIASLDSGTASSTATTQASLSIISALYQFSACVANICKLARVFVAHASMASVDNLGKLAQYSIDQLNITTIHLSVLTMQRYLSSDCNQSVPLSSAVASAASSSSSTVLFLSSFLAFAAHLSTLLQIMAYMFAERST
eukprot:CAMPEP_0201545830 /NCGR_PEP_ID=MMETSP0173_2-20130828/2255_1 /ASSEMBLY_ACC=CAM_ASM_000268 /TAXON_ID=218659 /ORGANISM="Vexillifera sp., Strain DIVA3 564/2" /LENGTH=745 /DNA_ID=CAMNT_0047954345 /DNA_START=15 /DNA_END=2252 /DNA_ORIENTATION=-